MAKERERSGESLEKGEEPETVAAVSGGGL
jgi:precorrin-3B methylase